MYAKLGGLKDIYCASKAFFTGQGFRAQEKLLNSFVLIREKSGVEEEVYVSILLLLSGRLINGESESEELAIVRYMEYVSFL